MMLQQRGTQSQKLLDEILDKNCNPHMVKFITKIKPEEYEAIENGKEDRATYRKLLGLSEFLNLDRKQIEQAMIQLAKNDPSALFHFWQIVTGRKKEGAKACS